MSSAPNDTYYNYNFGNDNKKPKKAEKKNRKQNMKCPTKYVKYNVS